jgi:ribA/ribD-fused uncharacterized protein
MDTIHFYRVADPYGEFSNFAPFPVTIDGAVWPTTEHYFQAQKFPGDPAYQEQIRQAPSPMIAARLGRSRKHPLRPDWEQVKDAVMLTALRAKLAQHPSLANLLRSTGDAVLVEHTANDAYWADAGDGSGRNQLGLLLMQIRDDLRSDPPAAR